MTPSEKAFFNWLRKTQPRLYAYFWKLKGGAPNGLGLSLEPIQLSPFTPNTGLFTTTGFAPTNQIVSGQTPDATLVDASVGGILDQIKNLADKYYQFDLQKQILDDAADAAAAGNPIPPTGNFPTINTPNGLIAGLSVPWIIGGLGLLYFFFRK